jgi:hypothetical protein
MQNNDSTYESTAEKITMADTEYGSSECRLLTVAGSECRLLTVQIAKMAGVYSDLLLLVNFSYGYVSRFFYVH